MENNQFHPPPPPPPPPPPSVVQPTSQEIYDYAAALLITQKKTVDEVRNELMRKGLDAKAASTVIADMQVAIANQRKIRAKKDMMYGGGICLLGLVITLVSYSVASSGGGGTYVVTWGAVIFGAIQFFRGLINSMK